MFSVFPTPVRLDPSPRYDVAVTTPVKNPSPSGLRVTPDPIRTSFCKVDIPVTFSLSVMMFDVPAAPTIVEIPAEN